MFDYCDIVLMGFIVDDVVYEFVVDYLVYCGVVVGVGYESVDVVLGELFGIEWLFYCESGFE